MEDWSLGDYFVKFLFCLAGVFFFGLGSGLVVVNLKKISAYFRKRSPEEAEIERRFDELDTLQKELSTFSPINEFAAYCKRKRVVDRLTEELNALSTKYQQRAMLSSMKETVVIRVLCGILAMSFAFMSYDLVLFYIKEEYLWPFNFLLSFPFMLLASGNRENETPVTLFSFLCIALTVRRIYERSRINAAKKFA